MLNLRQEYWPKFEKALGAKRPAKFYQVDNRLSLLVNLQLGFGDSYRSVISCAACRVKLGNAKIHHFKG